MDIVQRFYKKEILSSKLYCKATGAPFPFEPVGGDNGVLVTDNPVYTNELDVALKKGIGGVVAISQEEYESIKKKVSEKPSLKRLVGDRFSLSSLNLPIQSNVGPVAISGQPIHGQHLDTPPKSEPIKIPTEFVRPKVGKFLKREE